MPHHTHTLESCKRHRPAQWRKPGAEFGGRDTFFADQDDVFSEKIPILAAKISDDLFLVIGHVVFPLFPNFPELYFVRYRTQPFPHQLITFLLFSYFRPHSITLLLKILGGRMHGPSPHL